MKAWEDRTTEEKEDIIHELCEDEFMQPDIYEDEEFWYVETAHSGCFIVPLFVCQDEKSVWDYCPEYCYPNEELGDIEKCTGCVGRFSAPGYMDCTDWMWAETLDELLDTMIDWADSGYEYH